MAINYFESDNRYTNPIRYFKANDPYYFEVDNIPIKQLEENAKFLKDQVDGLIRDRNNTDRGRASFSELRPYVNGGDSTLRVKPGRFTARINDAYTKTPLQTISQVVAPNSISHPALLSDRFEVETVNGSLVSAALAKWQSKLAANATLMNGLFERTFIYPMQSRQQPAASLNGPALQNTQLIRVAVPGKEGHLHMYDTNLPTRRVGTYSLDNERFRSIGNTE